MSATVAQGSKRLQAVESLTVPTVSELDAAKLENLVLRCELLQMHLRQREAEIQGMVKGLERPGFILQRTPDGTWHYQPAPPANEDA